VKWEHFSLYECTWEPKCHLPSCITDDFTNPLTVTESRLQHISDLFLEHTHKRLSQRSVQQFYIYAELDLFRYLFGETGEVFPNGSRQLTLVILEGLFCLLIGINSFRKDAKAFVSNFTSLRTTLEGYDHTNITPYIHVMVFHVPEIMKKFKFKNILWTRG